MANSPEYNGKMDEKLMRQFLAVPFANGGGMLPDNVYQVIPVPERYTYAQPPFPGNAKRILNKGHEVIPRWICEEFEQVFC